MMSDAPLTPDQVKAARGLLGWSQPDLAAQVYMSESAIRLFESGVQAALPLDLDLIRYALEAAGVIFVEENGEGPGVRLRKGAK
jgi:transcriptional regulator with XRE-family HTH domain